MCIRDRGHTDGFTVLDHVQEIERFAGRRIVDTVIYNTGEPALDQIEAYDAEGAHVVEYDEAALSAAGYGTVSGNFLGNPSEKNSADVLPVTRGFIRHNIKTTGHEIIGTLEKIA